MKLYAELSKVKVGDDYPVRITGVINISPESFYKGSVRINEEEIANTALKMVEDGAEIIDVGAMSTAPYLETRISAEEEKERVTKAIKAIREYTDAPISVDTQRSLPADAAFKAGAVILNDVNGLKEDERLLEIANEYDASIVICAYEKFGGTGTPIERVKKALKKSLELAKNAGILEKKIVVDPAIGFFRVPEYKWYIWDFSVINNLKFLRELGRPVYIGVSRKSFLGKILNLKDPSDRLHGSLSATSIAVWNGAHVIRTHDVKPTIDAARIAEAIKQYSLV